MNGITIQYYFLSQDLQHGFIFPKESNSLFIWEKYIFVERNITNKFLICPFKNSVFKEIWIMSIHKNVQTKETEKIKYFSCM